MQLGCRVTIPSDRTIEKLVENIFNEIGRETYNFDGVVFSKESLTKALELCAKDQLFLFNGDIWKIIDGSTDLAFYTHSQLQYLKSPLYYAPPPKLHTY